MPMTKPAIPLSDPCALPLANAIAIEAHGPMPAAAITSPNKVKIGELVNTIIEIPVVTDTKQKVQIRRKLNSFFVDR